MPNITCMPLTPTLINKVAHYATDLLQKQLPKHFHYHSYEHTVYVVQAAKILAKKEEFSDQQTAIVSTAAWFHDVGNIVKPIGHEEESCLIAKAFLEKAELETETIDLILGCIMATRMPQSPQNDLEKVVCDADLYYLSQVEFLETSLLLRKEWGVLFDRHFSDHDFYSQNIKFLEMHQYWTAYGRNVLNQEKQKNIVAQRKLLGK